MPTTGDDLSLEVSFDVNKESVRDAETEMHKLLRGLSDSKGQDIFTKMAASVKSMTADLQKAAAAAREIAQAQQGGGGGQQPGGGGGGQPPQKPSPGPPQPKRPPRSQTGPGGRAMTSADYAAITNTALGQAIQMSDAGYSGGSLARGAGAMIGMAGPWGKVAQTALNYVGNQSDKNDEAGEQMLRLQRIGGAGVRNEFAGIATRPAGSDTVFDQQLLKRGEIEQLMRGLLQETGNVRGLRSTAILEGSYGLGQQAIGLQGALARGGGAQGYRELENTLAVAIQTGLDRGRIGEAFGMMTRLLQNNTTGVADDRAAANTAAFIGGAGAQYRGTSPAAMQMASTLESMSMGQGGPAADVFALRAAGLGSGASFAEAQLKVARGPTGGGVSTEQIVRQYAEIPSVKAAWMSGSSKGKANAAFLVSRLSGQNIATIYDILNRYYQGGNSGLSSDAVDKASRAMQGATFHKFDRKKRASEIEGEKPTKLLEGLFGSATEDVLESMMREGGISGPDDPRYAATVAAAAKLSPGSALDNAVGSAASNSGGGGGNLLTGAAKGLFGMLFGKSRSGGGNTRGARLSTDLKGIFDSMDADFYKQTGEHLSLAGKLSGERTMEEQGDLFDKYRAGGPLAHAPNKNAKHTRGLALDFDTTSKKALAFIRGDLSKYGLTQPAWARGQDDGHVEVDSAALNRFRAQAQDVVATAAAGAHHAATQASAASPLTLDLAKIVEAVVARMDVHVWDHRVTVQKRASVGARGTGIAGSQHGGGR